MIIKRKGVEYTLQETCGACPEQYDVYLDGEKVGYLRLRHGYFAAESPDCGDREVYSTTKCRGDGIFYDDERQFYLKKAIKHIHKWVKNNRSVLLPAGGALE